MEEEETMDDVSETQYILYENVATESQFDEFSMSWDESVERDRKRKSSDNESPIPQKNRRASVIKLNPQYGSGIRGKQQVRGESEQQKMREEPEQQQQEVRGEPEKKPQQRGEPEKHPQQQHRGEEYEGGARGGYCLLYTSPSPRDAHESRMPSSA